MKYTVPPYFLIQPYDLSQGEVRGNDDVLVLSRSVKRQIVSATSISFPSTMKMACSS